MKIHKHDAGHMTKMATTRVYSKISSKIFGNCEADQRLCFRYTDSTIPLLPKPEILSP